MHCCDVLCVISSDKGWRLESKTNFWGFQISVLWWLCPNSFSFLFPSQKHNGVGLGVLFWHCQARAQYAALDAWVPVKARSYRFWRQNTWILHTLVFVWKVSRFRRSLSWLKLRTAATRRTKMHRKERMWSVSFVHFWSFWFPRTGTRELILFKMFYVFCFFSKLSQGFFWTCGIKQISTSTCTIRAESQVTTLHVDDLVFSWQHGGRTEPRWHTEFYTQLLERDKVL